VSDILVVQIFQTCDNIFKVVVNEMDKRLFATPNGRKSKQEYSIIIENSRKRIMFLWPFVLFNSEASFTKQDFETMDSTLLFLATTFSGLSFVFC
jgi:hypothetical protein